MSVRYVIKKLVIRFVIGQMGLWKVIFMINLKMMNFILITLVIVIIHETFTIVLMTTVHDVMIPIFMTPLSLLIICLHLPLMIQKYLPPLHSVSFFTIPFSFSPLWHQYQSHYQQIVQVTLSF